MFILCLYILVRLTVNLFLTNSRFSSDQWIGKCCLLDSRISPLSPSLYLSPLRTSASSGSPLPLKKERKMIIMFKHIDGGGTHTAMTNSPHQTHFSCVLRHRGGRKLIVGYLSCMRAEISNTGDTQSE